MSSIDRLAPLPGVPAELEIPPAPLRGRRYGEDRLHLLVRDPRRAFATWEISPSLAAAAAERAASLGSPLRYRLVIERDPGRGGPIVELVATDLPDALGDDGWYVDLPVSGGAARARIGLALPSGFVPLLASRWTPVPPDGPCTEEGAWDLDAEGRAWLDRQAARAGGRGEAAGSPSSAARYLAPAETRHPE